MTIYFDHLFLFCHQNYGCRVVVGHNWCHDMGMGEFFQSVFINYPHRQLTKRLTISDSFTEDSPLFMMRHSMWTGKFTCGITFVLLVGGLGSRNNYLPMWLSPSGYKSYSVPKKVYRIMFLR